MKQMPMASMTMAWSRGFFLPLHVDAYDTLTRYFSLYGFTADIMLVKLSESITDAPQATLNFDPQVPADNEVS